jgi:thymidine kinase
MPTVAPGSITVVCGPMFSGKSSELIRRFRRAEIAKQPTAGFKATQDTRYSSTHVVSHDDNKYVSKSVAAPEEIVNGMYGRPPTVVGIDEAQFLGPLLAMSCEELANNGHTVVVAGLDMDYTGRPFESMASVMAIAEKIVKLTPTARRRTPRVSRLAVASPTTHAVGSVFVRQVA